MEWFWPVFANVAWLAGWITTKRLVYTHGGREAHGELDSQADALNHLACMWFISVPIWLIGKFPGQWLKAFIHGGEKKKELKRQALQELYKKECDILRLVINDTTIPEEIRQAARYRIKQNPLTFSVWDHTTRKPLT